MIKLVRIDRFKPVKVRKEDNVRICYTDYDGNEHVLIDKKFNVEFEFNTAKILKINGKYKGILGYE